MDKIKLSTLSKDDVVLVEGRSQVNTVEDIKELQVIFDRILARSPSCNIAYETDKLIEIDVSTSNG
ncbi:hypothetical protein [Ruminiclostridium cellulolyticum]|uniref:Uncharacterized protein n=1 Tax=Ruminiclostridium cellulolyticum (strain ATCC 35319 / DSM 5812 / JCM 6584 / H10) TaxID=394503 RepID=B8I0D6_RUMCH|nr:hypothetical protein [Ruminiclostridium cellulolyticum]ACL77462.1 hypothetical protein Ccel_3171 [Ruminiclostridium cellulolyticum H10]